MDQLIQSTMLRCAYVGSQIIQHVSPKLTAKVGTFLWFTPMRRKVHKEKEILSSQAKTKRIAFGRQTIFLRTWGEADPGQHLILIHGWGGSWDQFSSMINYFSSKGFKVTSLDFPAHGESKGISTNVYEWLDVLKEGLKDLGISRPVYVCHSFGLVPISYALLKEGLKAEGLVAINTPNDFDFMINQFLKKTHLSNKVGPYLRRNILNRFPQVDKMVSMSLKELSEKQPILYVVDKLDREVPFSLHEKVPAILGEKFVVMEGHGHNKILASNQLHQKMETFFESIS